MTHPFGFDYGDQVRAHFLDGESTFRALTAADFMPQAGAITFDPTGFTDPASVIVTYDPTTQKVTLTGTVVAYWRGSLVAALTTGWISAAHTNTAGHIYRLSYNGSAFVWTTDTNWTFDQLQICTVNYGSANKYAIRECHGLMPWLAHEVFHETIGTYRETGGILGSWTAASTTAGNRRPTVTATTIHDEDLITVNPALTSDLYTQVYLAGAAVTTYVLDAAEIVPVLADNPYYNLFSAPNWTQVLMANNSYMCIWLAAVPATASAGSQKYRYLWVQGQSNGNLASQQALTPSDLNLGSLQAEATEFVFISKIIIRYTGGNWDITSVTNLTGNKYLQVGSPAGVVTRWGAITGTLSDQGDLRAALDAKLNLTGGTVSYLTLPDGGTIGQAAGPLLTFNDTTNTLSATGANVSVGNTSSNVLFNIHSAAGAAESILEMTDSNVAHGMTLIASTNAFLRIAPYSTTDGGTVFSGMTDTGTKPALTFSGVIGSTDPTDTVTALLFNGGKSNGSTNAVALGATETVMQIQNGPVGGATVLMTVLGNGFTAFSGTPPVSRLDIGAGGTTLAEMTAPSAPAANGVIIYAMDNGAGKTQLMALFSSGVAQQLAIQP